MSDSSIASGFSLGALAMCISLPAIGAFSVVNGITGGVGNALLELGFDTGSDGFSDGFSDHALGTFTRSKRLMWRLCHHIVACVG